MDLGFTLDTSAIEQAKQPETEEIYDVLVLGGGPAAMTAVVYAARKMMKVAMITRDFGGQMAETSEIENYMGFQTITGEELTNKFQEQVKQFDVPISLEEVVTKVRREGELFLVDTSRKNTYRGRTVIVATGKRYRPLNVPGEKELAGRGVAFCATCDAPFFKGKKVAVAGGGNSAFTAALDLLKVATEVTIVNYAAGWQADEVMLAAVKKYGDKLKMLDEHEVTRIAGDQRVEAVQVKDRKSGEEKSIEADGIFVEIGLLPNSEPVADLVKLTDQNEVMVDCHCRTDVPGVYGAGDVTTVPFKQIVISAGEGAKAALTAYDYLTRQGLL